MFEELSNTDLAKLQAKFIVPIVVDQMLRDEEPLDDIAEQAMNDIISELQPDTALLCITLCARHIAASTNTLPEAQALAIESKKIINEYGPLWIAYENGGETMNPAIVREILSYIPEDMESIYALMENLLSALEEDHCIPAILCDVLCGQLEIHITEAENQLQAVNVTPQNRPEKTQQQEQPVYTDNIIAFPLAQNRDNARV